jgi:hypothetical protein
VNNIIVHEYHLFEDVTRGPMFMNITSLKMWQEVSCSWISPLCRCDKRAYVHEYHLFAEVPCSWISPVFRWDKRSHVHEYHFFAEGDKRSHVHEYSLFADGTRDPMFVHNTSLQMGQEVPCSWISHLWRWYKGAYVHEYHLFAKVPCSWISPVFRWDKRSCVHEYQLFADGT